MRMRIRMRIRRDGGEVGRCFGGGRCGRVVIGWGEEGDCLCGDAEL